MPLSPQQSGVYSLTLASDVVLCETEPDKTGAEIRAYGIVADLMAYGGSYSTGQALVDICNTKSVSAFLDLFSYTLTITVVAISIESVSYSAAASVGTDGVVAVVFAPVRPFSTLVNVYK